WNGLRLDPSSRQALLQACEERRDAALGGLRRGRRAPPGFKKDARADKKGFPEVPDNQGRRWVTGGVGALTAAGGASVEGPPDISLRVSLDAQDWAQLASCHRLLRCWSDLIAACNVLATLRDLDQDVIHSQYVVFPRLHWYGVDLGALRR